MDYRHLLTLAIVVVVVAAILVALHGLVVRRAITATETKIRTDAFGLLTSALADLADTSSEDAEIATATATAARVTAAANQRKALKRAQLAHTQAVLAERAGGSTS